MLHGAGTFPIYMIKAGTYLPVFMTAPTSSCPLRGRRAPGAFTLSPGSIDNVARPAIVNQIYSAYTMQVRGVRGPGHGGQTEGPDVTDKGVLPNPPQPLNPVHSIPPMKSVNSDHLSLTQQCTGLASVLTIGLLFGGGCKIDQYQ